MLQILCGRHGLGAALYRIMPLRVYPTLHDMRPTVASAERQVETFGLVRSLIQRDYPF